jgi:glycosyltransferase involved in cell wall biosynthesis
VSAPGTRLAPAAGPASAAGERAVAPTAGPASAAGERAAAPAAGPASAAGERLAARAPHRVLHVIPWFSVGGGVQRYVREILEHQRSEGLEVTLLTTSAHADREDPGHVRRVAAHLFLLRTPFAPAFRAEIERSDADLIHVHGPNPLVDWSVLGIERPYVYSLYNPFPSSPRVAAPFIGFGKRLSRWAMERALGIAVLDPGLVQEPWVRAERPVWHIPPGVDTRVFRPMGLRRRRQVAFVGHLRPEKGLHVLVRAMHELPADVELRVMGSVKYARSYARREFAEARRLLGDRFRWQPDPTDEEIARAFNEASCVAVPSTGLETWNLVMLEAAACGAPVVRSDLPALDWAEFAPSARAGDAADLACVLAHALDHVPELSARALAASRGYRWERTSSRLGAFYREALASAAASSAS